jgi:hypothetical protein
VAFETTGHGVQWQAPNYSPDCWQSVSDSERGCKLGDVSRNSRLVARAHSAAARRGKPSASKHISLLAAAFFMLLHICSSAHAAPSDYDLDQDSRISWADLAELASWWLAPCGADRCDGSNFNADGSVNFGDFALFAGHWQTTVLPDPIAWWKFDEGSGNIAADSSPGAHHAMITGASWDEGKVGWSLDFHGSGRYVTVDPAALSPLTGRNYVTVAFWQYGDIDMPPQSTAFQAAYSANPDQRVIAAQVAWYGTVYWDTVYAGQWDRVSKSADSSEYIGQWNHWAFTKDAVAGEMKVYLNGSLWASDTGKHNPLSAAAYFKIGANIEGNENYGGRIDDFRIFDICLTQDQIAAICSLGREQAAGFRQWAIQALAQIDRDLRKPGSYLYAEYANTSGYQSQTAYLWPQGIQFHALNNAASVDPDAYLARVISFADELHTKYWSYKYGRWGYDSSTTGGTRFYDDNAWIAMAYMKLYELTHNNLYLQRASDTIAFVMSGENSPPHSGIAWDEGSVGTSVCSTAPAVVANLLLYKATSVPHYLDDALRLYNWISDPAIGIQDAATGLYHQGCDQNLNVNWGYRAYQTAVPLRACLLFHEILADSAYLAEAQRLARAMEGRWVNRYGAFTETGQWGGFDMVEAYVDLYNVDSNSNWLYTVRMALYFLHNNSMDPNGRYPENWDTFQTTEIQTFNLLYQAPAATAYWKAAGTMDR